MLLVSMLGCEGHTEGELCFADDVAGAVVQRQGGIVVRLSLYVGDWTTLRSGPVEGRGNQRSAEAANFPPGGASSARAAGMVGPSSTCLHSRCLLITFRSNVNDLRLLWIGCANAGATRRVDDLHDQTRRCSV